MGMFVYTLHALQFCDVGMMPFTRAWSAGVALHLRSGERASEIDVARILSGAEDSVHYNCNFIWKAEEDA